MSFPRKNTLNSVPLLRTQDLCRDFPSGGFRGKSTRIVDNVNIEVHSGEIVGIVGESGSGKTTLARCCLRLLEPTSGYVYFDGQDLASIRPASLRIKRREFQMIFQDPYASLNPAMTVEEILLEPLQVHKMNLLENTDAYLHELLSAVSLDTTLIKRRPGELSGGQQQRVGIARGLALKPRLLIADEPVAALDVSVQAQILNLLADLKKQYTFTLILISHSLYVIHYLCDRVSVMYRGRIVEEAPATAFFNEPKHPYSRILLDSMPMLDAPEQMQPITHRHINALVSNNRSCCVFHEHCPQAFSICKEQIPSFKETGPGEKVACFLYL